MRVFGDKNVLKNIDDYNMRGAEDYFNGCEPKVIGRNEDNIADYNCEGCKEKDCPHWADYNNESEG